MLDQDFRKAMRRTYEQSGHLTKEQERELHARYRAGDASAGRQLEEANLPLVVMVATQFHSHENVRRYFELMDLVQIGWFGLRYAVERYDPNRGRFTTIATRCIRQRISKDLEKRLGIVRASNPARCGGLQRIKPLQAALANCIANTDALDRHRGSAPEECRRITPEQFTVIRRAIAALPRRERSMIHFVYFYRASTKVAARWAGLSEDSAKRYLDSALSSLAVSLRRIHEQRTHAGREAPRPELAAAG